LGHQNVFTPWNHVERGGPGKFRFVRRSKMSLVTSSATYKLKGGVAVRRSLSHRVAVRRIRLRSRLRPTSPRQAEAPAFTSFRRGKSARPAFANGYGPARQGSFVARIPGFQRRIGFERREYSRLFPPFPPLTAFGGSLNF
jgi:hypothetical protein